MAASACCEWPTDSTHCDSWSSATDSATPAAGTELAGQRVAAEAQPGRCFAAMAAGVRERGFEQGAVETRARLGMQVVGTGGQLLARPAGQCALPGIAGRGSAVIGASASSSAHADRVARCQRGEAPAQVLELAHVAGPVVRAQPFQRGLGEALGRCTELVRGMARNRSASCGTSSRRSRSGGRCSRTTSRRCSRSARKRPSATSCSSAWWVAATTRTSTRINSRPPTRKNSPSASTRSRRVCSGSGMSPISSRNSVPPSACSKRPTWRCSRR